MERKKCLLHICCAPDATVPWEKLDLEYDVVGYFYGNNIHPEEEYLYRKEAVEILGNYRRGELLFEDWDPREWLDATRIYAKEPEKGKRCSLCFYLQLSHAAKVALKRGCNVLCTTLTISPHKNVSRIEAIGKHVAARYELEWLSRIWRKGGGFQRAVAESRELSLYRQTYCGCLYSMETRGFAEKDMR